LNSQEREEDLHNKQRTHPLSSSSFTLSPPNKRYVKTQRESLVRETEKRGGELNGRSFTEAIIIWFKNNLKRRERETIFNLDFISLRIVRV
jgi:hypothetical protein